MARSLADTIGRGLINTSKLSIPELGALIEHLNLLYVQMKAKEGIKEDGTEPGIVEFLESNSNSSKAWYNPGHSAVTESA